MGGGNPGAGSQAPLFLSVVIVMVPNAVLAFRGVFCGRELLVNSHRRCTER